MQRPTNDRLAGCHHWASDLHLSLTQLCDELDDLGQQQAVERLAIARQQIELACAELEACLLAATNTGILNSCKIKTNKRGWMPSPWLSDCT